MSNTKRLTDRLAETVVTGMVASWLVATATSQTPDRRFDAARRVDRSDVLIPNWWFFAPTPADKDDRVAYRLRFGTGEVSRWMDLYVPPRRRLHHALFFPDRRRGKGIGDHVGQVLNAMCNDFASVESSQGYRGLDGIVRRAVTERHVGDVRGIVG